MSRSCQSATFSSDDRAAARTTRASPQIRSATIGLRLCGIADEPFWPLAERLLHLAHLGAGEVADLGREPLERRGEERERRKQLGVAVARDDLRRRRLGARARAARRRGARPRVAARVGADGARELADAHALERPREPLAVAVELERPARELRAEGDRLGVDAVRAADHRRRAVLLGAAHDGRERPVEPSTSSAPASRTWSASAVSSTSEEVSP